MSKRTRWIGILAVFASMAALTLAPAAPASAVLPPPSVTLGTTSDSAVMLQKVACASTTECVALGTNLGQTSWYVVAIHAGVPDTPQLIPGAGFMTAIACSDTHNCVAVGDHVVAIVDGVAGAPQTVPLRFGVACPTASQCYAVGNATVVSIVNGTVTGSPTTTPFANIWGVSCVSASTCAVVGDNPLPIRTNIYNSAWAVMTNGVVGAAHAIHANQDSTFDDIKCVAPKFCYIGGSVLGEASEAVRINVVALSVSAVIDEINYNSPEIDSAACPTTRACVYSAVNSLVLTTQTGYFRFIGGVNLAANTNVWNLACPSALTCIAVGDRPDPANPGSYLGVVQRFSVT